MSPPRDLTAVGLLVGAALLFAACGGGKETSSSITSKSSDEKSITTETTEAISSSTTAKKATTTTTKPGTVKPHLSIPSLPVRPTTTVPGTTIPPSDRRVTDLTGFTSPSGNIGCYIDPTYVRCDINERSWSPPPPPPGCDLDYGQGIAMEPGGAADLVCAGDTALGGGSPLPYGQSIGAGVLRCASAETGMTCNDVTTGRGFSLSKEGYQLF